MGVVYEALDTRLGRSVALKFLPPEMGRDPQALDGSSGEWRAALNHQTSARYAIEQHDRQRFIVMGSWTAAR